MGFVFLPVESTVRELDYKINLARFFCEQGLTVILGNPPFLRDELKYKNYAALFLEKGLNPDPSYYAALASKGVCLYDLGDEGAARPVYSINYPPAVDALKHMRKIFLWGEAQKADLLQRNSDAILMEKYHVIGNPAFDLCTPKYKTFHKKLKPQSIPNAYILVNTNFGCFQSYTLDQHLEACNLISPASKAMIEASYQLEKKQFPVFQEWLEALIQAWPNEHFVIRPHPSEIEKNYQDVFGHYKNVLISKQGNVNQLIASAKLVLHKDCSTAMQAYVMGVPAISLGGQLSEEYVSWPLSFSAVPHDIRAAKALVAQTLSLKGFNPELQARVDQAAASALRDHFHDVGNSSRTLVEVMLKDADVKSTGRLKDIRPWHLQLKAWIRKWLPLHYKVPAATRETLVPFTRKDVLQRLEFLELADPLGLSFCVKKLFPNAFQISKK